MLLWQLNLSSVQDQDDRVPVLVLEAEGSEIILPVDREWPVAMAAER